MKLISEMTTAELLAEHNSTTGKSTTKFASRAAGEKAVQKLRDENAAQSDNVAKSVARSTSTSETWNDKAIAAKRSQRHNVNVIFNGGSQAASFRSVRQAFVLLKLPVAKHIPFRMALKKEKSKTFEHDGIVYTFSIESK